MSSIPVSKRKPMYIPKGNPFAQLKASDFIDRALRRMPHGDYLVTVDYFCGAGGLTTGVLRARDELNIPGFHYAVNHDEKSIQTVWSNHHGKFVNSSVATIPLREIVQEGYVSLFTGAAECTTYSKAASKDAPIYDQSRTSAAYMLESIRDLPPEAFIIENVAEWLSWKDNSTRNASGTGKYFLEFLDILRKIGYHVEYKILNAADYGAATSRKRVFVCGVAKGRGMWNGIPWPQQTHAEHPEKHRGLQLLPWEPARKIIDWTDLGESIFERDDLHAAKSLRRTKTGFTKQEKHGAFAYARSLEQLTPISQAFHVTRAPKFEFTREDWRRNKAGLNPYTGEIKPKKTACPWTAQEWIYVSNAWRTLYGLPHDTKGLTNKERKMILETGRKEAKEAQKYTFAPPTAIFQTDDVGEIAAFIIANRTNSQGRDVRYDPLHAISTATGGGERLITPRAFVFGQQGGAVPRDPAQAPLPNVATDGAITLIQVPPMIDQQYGKSLPVDIEQPLPSPMAEVNKLALINSTFTEPGKPLHAEPFGVIINHGGDDARTHDLNGKPVPSPTQRGFLGIVQTGGFIVREQGYYGDVEASRAIEGLHEPISSPNAGGKHHLLVTPGEPFILQQHAYDNDGISSPDDTLPGLTTISRHGVVQSVMNEAEPIIVNRCSDEKSGDRISDRTTTTNEALPNVAQDGAGYLANPILIQNFGERPGQTPRCRTLDEPLYTICPGKGAGVIMRPRTSNPLDEYKPWVIINGIAVGIDILFRMLRWDELARAMGFIQKKKDYVFVADCESDIIRMIGNAVNVEQAKALALPLIKNIAMKCMANLAKATTTARKQGRRARVKAGLHQSLRRAHVETLRGTSVDVNLSDNSIVYQSDFDPFLQYQIGKPFGLYDEIIELAVHAKRGDPKPSWFSPKKKENHIAIFEGDQAIYLCLRIDQERRAQYAPFARLLEKNADRHEMQPLFDVA